MLKYFMSFILAVFCLFKLSLGFSHSVMPEQTIYTSSIEWDDETSKKNLLDSIPQWETDTIKSLFDIYRYPERHQFPFLTSDTVKYNIHYINALWGPLNNPFNKHPRPAKAFLFIKNNEELALSYMAPIIQNKGEYYIFDRSELHPILLTDWVKNIKKTVAKNTSIYFNVCNAYGNLPADSCYGKSYQSEADDAYKDSQLSLSHRMSSSAYRAPNQDWESKAYPSMKRSDSIYKLSILWNNIAARNVLLKTVQTWPNSTDIQENFFKIRNFRYFQNESNNDFLRRISWLYPNNGCWTRASAAIKDFFGPLPNSIMHHFSRPSKVFAFGNLCALTPNAEDGKVTWWYHTAPIVRDAETNQTYVLDPSVNPHTPLTIEKWIDSITSRSDACASTPGSIYKFNICNGYTANPSDACSSFEKTSFADEASSMLEQDHYQVQEWMRQVELKRDPFKVLGDQPPWV